MLKSIFKRTEVDNEQVNLQREYELLHNQFKSAKIDLQIAEQFFNYADKRYCDVSILNLEVAKIRLSNIIQELKDLELAMQKTS